MLNIDLMPSNQASPRLPGYVNTPSEKSEIMSKSPDFIGFYHILPISYMVISLKNSGKMCFIHYTQSIYQPYVVPDMGSIEGHVTF